MLLQGNQHSSSVGMHRCPCMHALTNCCCQVGDASIWLYDSALSDVSSRKGTCETATHLQKDGQRHASSGAPSAFVRSPAQHQRLQACFSALQESHLRFIHGLQTLKCTAWHCLR